MIDKQAIILDLQEKKLTQGQIAQKHNCSRITVVRIVKEYNLQYGQGFSHHWSFSVLTPELSYLIGIYLTDGYIRYGYRTGNINQFEIGSTTPEISQKCHEFLKLSGLPSRISYRDRTRTGRQATYLTSCYSTHFSTWLHDICHKKSVIPEIIMNASLENKIAFISGAIDGDGTVSRYGIIYIRGIDDWLLMLPNLLDTLSIPCTGCQVASILPSGKEYRRVFINRKYFIKLNPQCHHPIKQDRMYNAKETRVKRR